MTSEGGKRGVYKSGAMRGAVGKQSNGRRKKGKPTSAGCEAKSRRDSARGVLKTAARRSAVGT